MASVGPRTGGIRKSSNTEVTKLDFTITDLAPALNGRSEGEDKATVIENFRKHYDGSYVKRAGTKSMLDLKKIIIDGLGEWGWDNFNSADTFTDRYNDEVHEMIIMLIDGQPYVKEIMGEDNIRRIPLLIYDEFNGIPQLSAYKTPDTAFDVRYMCGTGPDQQEELYYFRGSKYFSFGLGSANNYERPIQGVHHVYYDKVFSKFAQHTKTEELYDGKIWPYKYTPYKRETDLRGFLVNQNFVDLKYRGWNNLSETKIKVFNVHGKLFITIENRFFELNIGNNTLLYDDILKTPWDSGVSIADKTQVGLDSIYYHDNLNNDTDLWQKTTNLSVDNGNKNYYLVEVPHMIVPTSIYNTGVRNYNSVSPNTATPYFNITGSKKELLSDYSGVAEKRNWNPFLKTYQTLYKGVFDNEETIDINQDNKYKITYLKIFLYNDVEGIEHTITTYRLLDNVHKVIDHFGNIVNSPTIGKLSYDDVSNQWHFHFEKSITHFATDIIRKAIGASSNNKSWDEEWEGIEFEFWYTIDGSPDEQIIWLDIDGNLNEIFRIDIKDMFFDNSVQDDFDIINDEFWKKARDHYALNSVTNTATYFGSIINTLIIDIWFGETKKSVEIISNYFWRSLKPWEKKEFNDDTHLIIPEISIPNDKYRNNLRLAPNVNLFKTGLTLQPNSLIIDYFGGNIKGFSAQPVYNGRGFYALNNSEQDSFWFRHRNLNWYYYNGALDGIWNYKDNDNVTIDDVREDFTKYDYVIQLDLSVMVSGTTDTTTLYAIFENLFNLNDSIDWVVVYGDIDSWKDPEESLTIINTEQEWNYIDTLSISNSTKTQCDYNKYGEALGLNTINGDEFTRANGSLIDISDDNTDAIFTFIISVPSSMGVAEVRSVYDNADPTLPWDEGVEEPTIDDLILPYQYSTVSWNYKKMKPIFSQLLSSTVVNTNIIKEAYNKGIEMSGDIVKVLEIKGKLAIVKKHSIYIDMYSNYIFNYILPINNNTITDVFMYQGALYIVLNTGDVLVYNVKDEGTVDGLSISYRDIIRLTNAINGDIKAIVSGNEFIYLITDSGFYDIYSISFNGATPTIKTRLLSGILEPYALDDIRDASSYKIIISGESVFFILKDIKKDDGTMTSKVYIRDKIQSKFYWSVYVGDVWNIKKMINMIDSKTRFIFLTDDYQVLDFGYREKIFPNLDNSPTEQIFLDKYIIDETGTPQGDNYNAVIKTNIINMSSPYDVSVNKIWVKLNFKNKKSLVTTNVSYMKNGELYRNNRKSVDMTRRDGSRLIQSISTKAENNLSSTKKRLKTRKTRVKDSTFVSRHLKNYVDNTRNTDKWFETITDENIEIKNSSFVTSGYSVEFSHNANAPMEFKGLIVEQKRKDKILK